MRWENLAVESNALDVRVRTNFNALGELGVRDFKKKAHVGNQLEHALGKLGGKISKHEVITPSAFESCAPN